MARKLFGVLSVALVLFVGAALAEDIVGMITKVEGKDAKSGVLTVVSKSGDKETTYTITTNDKTEFFKAAGRGGGGGGGRGKGGKGKGGGGGGGDQPPTPTKATFDELQAQVKAAQDAGRGGVNATVTTDGAVTGNKGTAKKVETKGGGGRRGGGDQ